MGGYADTGGASRFFYVAKASASEKNAGLDGMPTHEGAIHLDGGPWKENKTSKSGVQKREPRQNSHPTVKPIKLMRYLCRLITPPNGIVLDPFMGSGSTGLAAREEGFDFIGIEREAEYFEIAKRRLS
jgi:site-specific DNA-methyltransferase (adenine-specific)